LAKVGTLSQRWRVPLGFLLAIVFILFSRPTKFSLITGLAVALLGLAIRAWASGHIRKNSVLAVTGPYAFTRNPLYLGSFILGLGASIASGRWWLALIFAVAFLSIYLPVMRVEEGEVAEIFGNKFKQYAEKAPLFFPRLTRYKHDGENMGFDIQLYLRYREYRAALGMVVLWALLIARMLLFELYKL